MNTFRRLSVKVSETGEVTREIENADLDAFDTHDLLIKVAYSSLNYKDALSASGNKGISRFYPHTPGIDASGIVVRSKSPHFKEGNEVIVTGHDLGMNTRGGFSEYISVPAHWAVPLPENMSLKESMMLGTAGLTAAMSINRIIHSDLSKQPVIVSGATGGVGSIALLMLKKMGIETVAYSRRSESVDFLKSLGASEVTHSWEESPKPMLKGLYSAGIDTVGGSTLENMIKCVNHGGGIAVCGMAQSPIFSTSVFPFILRGLSLYGIESAEAPAQLRAELWQLLADAWKPNSLEAITRTVTLETLEPEIQQMLDGKALGRVVVELRN
jgi:acrylyl-CoA reductase (NADPH)